MAINTKAVKARINSVKNTKKITKAMEMIAAVKMRKAVEAAVNTREYSKLANDLLKSLGNKEQSHPLSKNRKVKNELVILITSNRGLCGGYNSKVLKKFEKYLSETNTPQDNIKVLAIGKKAADYAKKRNIEVVSLYEKLSDKPMHSDVLPISEKIKIDFLDKQFDKVNIIFTNYISGLNQEVVEKQILPISSKVVKELLENTGRDSDVVEEIENEPNDGEIWEYEFEPSKKQLIDYIFPMLIEITVYQAVLESVASEHSSRMIAMKNATESAGEMIDELTLEFNKGRQAAITQEVSEIVSGTAALG